MRKHSMLLACAGMACAGVLLAAMPVAAAGYNVSSKSCVSDNANILSSDTETVVENLSVALQEECGAQIGVYTVENIGNTDLEQYTYNVFNTWGLGDAQKDNGVLLVLTPGDDDYISVQGEGLETTLPTSTLQNILNNNMESYWVKGDYDAGTQATVKAIAKELVNIYSLNMDVEGVARGSTADNENDYLPSAPAKSGGSGLGTLVLIILIVVVIIVIIRAVSRPTRRRYYNNNSYAARRYYTPPMPGVNRRNYYSNGPGFGGGAPSRPSTPRPGSGFSFGGGTSSSSHTSSRLSGGGIHSGGGSFKAGGGSTRGGGARRGG